ESGDKSKGIKGVVLKWHKMRIGQYQVPVKQMHALAQHKRRNVATARFNAYLLPPSGKACRPTAELQQGLYPRIVLDELGDDLFLPDFGTFVPAFIPKLIGVGMLAVKEPF